MGCASPSRLIDPNFWDLLFCFPFADNNLVGDLDGHNHFEYLRQVFQIMKNCGLVLNIVKCEFEQPSF